MNRERIAILAAVTVLAITGAQGGCGPRTKPPASNPTAGANPDLRPDIMA